MKSQSLFFILLLATLQSLGQEKIAKQTIAIHEEGLRLYRSEMASWNGTDIFLAKYENKQNIGGYFSYADGAVTRCIFFSMDTLPVVIGTITFDSTYNPAAAGVEIKERDFTSTERDLYLIRSAALKLVNTDTFFKKYQNTSLNLIPIISKDEKKVYVLTGPEKSGVVVFGNDYLLTFDKSNKLTGKKHLHQNIIAIKYNGQGEDTSSEGTMHTHLPETGDFITATDICTLMLYEKFAHWKRHTVVSKNYLSIWDCENDQLAIISRKAVDKIDKDDAKRHRK